MRKISRQTSAEQADVASSIDAPAAAQPTITRTQSRLRDALQKRER